MKNITINSANNGYSITVSTDNWGNGASIYVFNQWSDVIQFISDNRLDYIVEEEEEVVV